MTNAPCPTHRGRITVVGTGPMAYLVCPSCEQKALPVATRCPRCGRAFEGQRIPVSSKPPRRNTTALVLLSAGIVVSLLAANSLMQRLNTPARSVAVSAAPVAAPQPVRLPQPLAPQPPSPAAVSVDTPLPPATPVAAKPRPAPRPATIASPAQPAPAQPTAPEPAPADTAHLRYASTWTNVRADRSNAAEVLLILRPGEGVQVDRLEQGWYRIRSETEQVGYVDRRLLESSPALATP